jgi:hypothetical protein
LEKKEHFLFSLNGRTVKMGGEFSRRIYGKLLCTVGNP